MYTIIRFRGGKATATFGALMELSGGQKAGMRRKHNQNRTRTTISNLIPTIGDSNCKIDEYSMGSEIGPNTSPQPHINPLWIDSTFQLVAKEGFSVNLVWDQLLGRKTNTIPQRGNFQNLW